MTLEARVKWLKFGAAVTIGSGLMIAAAAVPPLAGLAEFFIDLAFLPVDGLPGVGAPATRLLAAIGGAVLVGWGTMLHLVATRVFTQDPALGRTLILAPILAWFALDGLMSVAAGAPFNLFLNVGFLLVFVVPVWKLPTVSATGRQYGDEIQETEIQERLPQ